MRHIRVRDIKTCPDAGREVDVFAYDVVHVGQDPPELPYTFTVMIAVVVTCEDHGVFFWVQFREGAPVVAGLVDVASRDRRDDVK